MSAVAPHARYRSRSRPWRPVAAGAAAFVVTVPALAAWPVPALIGLGLLAAVVLAIVRPLAGLVAAIAVFLLEGTVKMLLLNAGVPFDSALALGAAALDIVLFSAVASVLLRGPRITPRAAWARLTSGQRVVVGATLGWLALTALQIPLSPAHGEALASVRLTHAYVLVGLAVAVVAADARRRDIATTALLWALLPIMLYAALRGIIGPDPAERAFALARGGVVAYGGAFRGLGTFSGAIGLTTVAAPLTVFAAVLGALSPRHRLPAFLLAGAALVAQVATYGRTPLVATAMGLLFAALLIIGRRTGRRRKVMVAGVAVGCVVALGVGAVVASTASPALADRLDGLLHPASDLSMQMRFDGWEAFLDQLDGKPFGIGLGEVGRDPSVGVTTDSSYLTTLVEQGYPGAALFLVALLGGTALVARRLGSAPEHDRAVGIAALAGFFAFLVMMATIEAIQQPGKVVAWGLLGLAAASAWAPGELVPRPAGRSVLDRLRDAAAEQEPRERLAWLAAAAVVLAITVTPALLRERSYAVEVPVYRAARPPIEAPPRGPEYIRSISTRIEVAYRIPRSAGQLHYPRIHRHIRILPAEPPADARIRVDAPTPGRAAELLEAVARELGAGSARELGGIARTRLAITEAALRSGPSRARRRLLTGRARRLRALLADVPERVAIPPRPGPPEPRRALDELADALPGPFPQRPGVPGLAVGVLLFVAGAWLARLALVAGRRGA